MSVWEWSWVNSETSRHGAWRDRSEGVLGLSCTCFQLAPMVFNFFFCDMLVFVTCMQRPNLVTDEAFGLGDVNSRYGLSIRRVSGGLESGCCAALCITLSSGGLCETNMPKQVTAYLSSWERDEERRPY